MDKKNITESMAGFWSTTVAIAKKAAPVSARAARTMALARLGTRINEWFTQLVLKCMPESVQNRFPVDSKSRAAVQLFIGQLGVLIAISLEDRVPENQKALVRAAAHAAGYSSGNALMNVLDFESFLIGIIGKNGVEELLTTHIQVLEDEAAELEKEKATAGNV